MLSQEAMAELDRKVIEAFEAFMAANTDNVSKVIGLHELSAFIWSEDPFSRRGALMNLTDYCGKYARKTGDESLTEVLGRLEEAMRELDYAPVDPFQPDI